MVSERRTKAAKTPTTATRRPKSPAAAPPPPLAATDDGRRRVAIDRVLPEVDGGRFPIKRTVGEAVEVTAWVHADGHDVLAVRLQHRPVGSPPQPWTELPMEPLGNDEWQASFVVEQLGAHEYTVEAWVDHFLSWRRELAIKSRAGVDVTTELIEGAHLVAAAAARCRPTAPARPAARSRVAAGGSAAPDDDREHLEASAAMLESDADASVRVGAALDDRLLELMARHADRSLAVGLRPRADGGSRPRAGAVRRLVRDVSAFVGSQPDPRRHLRRGRRAPAQRRGARVRRGLPAAHSPDRHQLSQGSRQHPRRGSQRPRQPVGHRLAGRRPQGRGAGARHARRLRRVRGGGPPRGARGGARHRLPVLARPPLRHASTRSGSVTGPTARSSTPRTRRRSTRTSIRSTSRPRPGRRCGRSCPSVIRFWIGHGVKIFRVDNPAHQAVRLLGVADRRAFAATIPT